MLMVIAVVFSQCCFRFFLSYSFADQFVRVRFFGVQLSRIPYAHIREVRLISLRAAYFRNPFTCWRYANRLWFRQAVLIVKKYALIRYIILTPSRPDEVVNKIQSMIDRQFKSTAQPATTMS